MLFISLLFAVVANKAGRKSTGYQARPKGYQTRSKGFPARLSSTSGRRKFPQEIYKIQKNQMKKGYDKTARAELSRQLSNVRQHINPKIIPLLKMREITAIDKLILERNLQNLSKDQIKQELANAGIFLDLKLPQFKDYEAFKSHNKRENLNPDYLDREMKTAIADALGVKVDMAKVHQSSFDLFRLVLALKIEPTLFKGKNVNDIFTKWTKSSPFYASQFEFYLHKVNGILLKDFQSKYFNFDAFKAELHTDSLMKDKIAEVIGVPKEILEVSRQPIDKLYDLVDFLSKNPDHFSNGIRLERIAVQLKENPEQWQLILDNLRDTIAQSTSYTTPMFGTNPYSSSNIHFWRDVLKGMKENSIQYVKDNKVSLTLLFLLNVAIAITMGLVCRTKDCNLFD